MGIHCMSLLTDIGSYIVTQFSLWYYIFGYYTGPGCSKLKMSLFNVTLKFQTLISEICQMFFVEKMREVQKLPSFFQQKTSV